MFSGGNLEAGALAISDKISKGQTQATILKPY